MTFPKARLAVAACLFLGWLGFLLFLVIDSRRIILSRPQFLVADAYVVVQLREGGRGDLQPMDEATIDHVLWIHPGLKDIPLEREVHLPELLGCSKAEGYAGAGKYVVPLTATADGWRIASLPNFVGFYARSAPTHGSVEARGVFSHRTRRLLPLGEARALRKEWQAAGFDVVLYEEELRIYPWTSDTEAQVNELIAAK